MAARAYDRPMPNTLTKAILRELVLKHLAISPRERWRYVRDRRIYYRSARVITIFRIGPKSVSYTETVNRTVRQRTIALKTLVADYEPENRAMYQQRARDFGLLS